MPSKITSKQDIFYFSSSAKTVVTYEQTNTYHTESKNWVGLKKVGECIAYQLFLKQRHYFTGGGILFMVLTLF